MISTLEGKQIDDSGPKKKGPPRVTTSRTSAIEPRSEAEFRTNNRTIDGETMHVAVFPSYA